MAKRDDEDLAQAWQELMSRYHRVSCVLDSTLQTQHGISASEFAVLERLAETKPEHSLKMNDLGEHAHLSQSALSRLVARLETDGLVARTMCTEDRRCVYAGLTPNGLAVYESARPTHREVLRVQRPA
jgi:DNA-binding MarR family transcriptional regulator